MSIAYNFEVVSVDQSARVMEVKYTSKGRQTMHVSARLPYVGESLNSVIDMYAPVAYWREQETAVESVSVGASGLLGNITPDTLDSIKALKREEISAMSFAFEVGGARFNGTPIHTDRQSQAALVLAYLSIKEGLIQSVDWKTADGSFITLSTGNVAELASFVAAHVQQAFSMEKALHKRIDAATTINEVKSIVWQ